MIEAVLDYWNPKNETVVTETGFRYLDTTSVITKDHLGTHRYCFV